MEGRPLKKALEGLQVLVLRPEGQGDDLADLLRGKGAHPIVIPAVRIVPLQDPAKIDDALEALGEFDWLIFTSVNGVQAFLDRLEATDRPIASVTVSIAAIGPATRDRLEQAGLRVSWVPGTYTTKALAAQLPAAQPASVEPRKTRACLFRADIASGELEDTLMQRGFEVHRVDAYGTESINAGRIKESLKSVEAVVLTSASIVRSFVAASQGAALDRVRIFSIGPATSEECLAYGLTPEAQAAEHTISGLVEALTARGYP